MSSRFIISAWVIYLTFALYLLTQKTQITSDLTFFLPKATQPEEKTLLTATREGPGSRMLLAEISGGTQQQRFIASDALVQQLRRDDQLVRVQNGADAHDLYALEDRLFPYRFILTPPPPNEWEAVHLHEALNQRVSSLFSGTGRLEERWLEQDPLGHWKRYLDQLQSGPMPSMIGGHWVDASQSKSLILIETRAAGFNLEAQEEAQRIVQAAFKQVPHTGLTLTLGGAGALAVETNHSITREAGWLSLVNTLMVSGLLMMVYRSWRILALGLIPLLTGLITGALAIRLQYGAIHAITLGFGSTLLGVAADYPNHFFTHLHPTESSHTTIKRLWPTLRLGILTNIAGFGVMFFSGFKGLQEIGVFAAAGLLGAGLSTRWILPILAPPRSGLGAWMALLSKNPIQRVSHRFRLTLCLGLPVALGLAFQDSGQPLFNDDLATLNPVSRVRLEKDLALQHAFRVPDLRWLILVSGISEEEALARSEKLRPILSDLKAHRALSGFDLVSTLFPSGNAQSARRSALPSPEAAQKTIEQAVKNTPFKSNAFNPLIHDLALFETLPPLSHDTFKGTILESKIDAQMVNSAEVTSILIPLEGIDQVDVIQNAIRSVHDPAIQFVDLRAAMSQRIRDNRMEAFDLLLTGLAVIFAILTLGLKSLSDATRIMAPMLLATISTGLLLAILFKGLNIYHLASILLVMGLSLDQALFFNRPCTGPAERARTHLSILLCSLSSILAFGGLAFASIPLLVAIGSTVSIGAMLAVSFSALLAK